WGKTIPRPGAASSRRRSPPCSSAAAAWRPRQGPGRWAHGSGANRRRPLARPSRYRREATRWWPGPIGDDPASRQGRNCRRGVQSCVNLLLVGAAHSRQYGLPGSEFQEGGFVFFGDVIQTTDDRPLAGFGVQQTVLVFDVDQVNPVVFFPIGADILEQRL